MKVLKVLNKPVAFIKTNTYNFEVYDIPEDILKIVKGSFLWDECASRDEKEFQIYHKIDKPYIYTIVGIRRYIFHISREREVRRYIRIIRRTIETMRGLNENLSTITNLTKLREVFYEGQYFPELLSDITIADNRANVEVLIKTEHFLLQKFLELENIDYIKNPDDLLKVKIVWENYLAIKEKRLENFLKRP